MSNTTTDTNGNKRVGSGVVWKVEHAHQGVVNTIQFNPFVPYWVASAGMGRKKKSGRGWGCGRVYNLLLCSVSNFFYYCNILAIFSEKSN
jgi:hypothetical protein